ncbi:hypothetical protein V1318_14090 [Lysobacter sp. CCNWLW3]|uniref:hypothetical protein n=1 Tax=unclassified Lysobacter TaxID=2635362 RepID=UPI002FCF2B5E
MQTAHPLEDHLLDSSQRLQRLRAWWGGMAGPARLYCAGWVLAVAGVVVMAVHGVDFVSDVVFMTGMACCAIGFVVDTYLWGVRRLNPHLMKVVSSILGVMAATAAAGGSAWTVSEATSQDPSHFKTTITFLTPLSFMPILGLAVIVCGIVAMPLFLSLAGTKLATQKAGGGAWMFFARMLGYLFLLLLASWAASSSYGTVMRPLAARAAYSLDMHRDPSCSTAENDRITRINNDLVIVGRLTSDGPKFLRKACALVAQAEELPPPETRPTRSAEDRGQH